MQIIVITFQLHEFEVAVTQRDEVIRTLSSNLRSVTENRDTLQAEYLSQAGQLVEQVHTLQDQLRQVDCSLYVA